MLDTTSQRFAAEILARFPEANLTSGGAWVGHDGRAGAYAKAREAGKTPKAAAKLVSLCFED